MGRAVVLSLHSEHSEHLHLLMIKRFVRFLSGLKSIRMHHQQSIWKKDPNRTADELILYIIVHCMGLHKLHSVQNGLISNSLSLIFDWLVHSFISFSKSDPVYHFHSRSRCDRTIRKIQSSRTCRSRFCHMCSWTTCWPHVLPCTAIRCACRD